MKIHLERSSMSINLRVPVDGFHNFKPINIRQKCISMLLWSKLL